MAAEHILKNTRAVLENTFSAGDADGAVTITITRADGTALVTGAATTNETEAGRYTYALAPQTELDALTAVWTGAWGAVTQTITTYVEIVGDYLFTLADLRVHGDKALASTTTYPDTTLREARARITDTFEDICGVSFIPRYGRETLDGTGKNRLFLDRGRVRRLISVTVDDVALTAPELADLHLYDGGWVHNDTYWSTTDQRNIVVAYEHGYQHPPADISRAGMILARYELVSNDISDRMVSFDNDLGSVRLSVPGRQYPTGIPIVDATLARYDQTVLVGP